jgi:hypothetical protein
MSFKRLGRSATESSEGVEGSAIDQSIRPPEAGGRRAIAGLRRVDTAQGRRRKGRIRTLPSLEQG